MNKKNHAIILPALALWLSACAHQPCPAPSPCPASQPAASQPAARKAAAGEASGNLVLRGTPQIPDQLRRRLGQYLENRAGYLERLSDNGRAMLISTRFAQTSQVHLVRRPLGARTQITFKPEPLRGASFVPGSTDAITYISDVGGNERYQIFRLDLKDGKTTRLSDGQSRHGPYAWSHDGSRMAYTNNARNGRDMDLYLGDGRDPASQKLLLERQGHWAVLDWTRDNKRLLVMEYVSINDSRLYVVDVAGGKAERISPAQPTAAYRAARFDRGGKYVYAASDRDGEFVELYRLELASKTWKPLSRGVRWNVEQLDLSPDGRSLAFTTNEDGYSVLRLLDTRSLRQRLVPGIPRGIISALQFARNSPRLGFTVVGATSPGDSYTYDLRRKKLVRWTESEVGGLAPAGFVEPELFHYQTFDGRKIPCFHYKPAGAGPHPVLVWIHGGPEGQARPSFRAVVQYLVRESGIAVLVPNVRGSDGYGKSYLLLDNGFLREDSVKDIGALLDWVKGNKELDAARLGVLGGSYGGYMVLAALVHFADRIVAGVDVVGISNFVTFLKNTKAYRRDLRRAEYGDERDPKMEQHLQRISPNNNVQKIRSALFVAHGANDPRVPLSETDQIVEAVQKSGKDVWYMVAKNEGHGFRKKENRDRFWELTVLFFEKHLGAAR